MKLSVRPKKSLGQHFLKDENIARKIVGCLPPDTVNIVEVGPGMGVLTGYILGLPGKNVYFIETDRESVDYLQAQYPESQERFLHADFLDFNPSLLFPGKFSIIGNFPYNISSQIFFKILEHREQVTDVICMIQKEVAERLASEPGSKRYGILSVLLQSFYTIDYLFTVNETVFSPPPKVKSAVIQLKRNARTHLGCDEKMFFRVVKTAFNQRRKTLRNALRPLSGNITSPDFELFSGKRAEMLSVEEFATLTAIIENESAL